MARVPQDRLDPVLRRMIAAALLGGYAAHVLRPRGTPPLIDLRLFDRPAFGASVVAAALLLAPFGLGSALVMPLAGRLSDRLGSRVLAVGGAERV
ncbi:MULTISPECIES: hypothetical protein [unclassified Frankia]